MVDLDMESFEEMLDGFIASRGIEKTILQIIFPYLNKIGILWMTNHINPAQEHLVSNIIRQKLIVGIQNSESLVSINKSVLLFLPEGEYHELGLLFMNFLLKSKGIATIYLGCSISTNHVDYVVKLKKPDYIYTHLTSCGSKFNFEKFLEGLSKKFAETPVVISGQFTQSYHKKITSPLVLKRTFSEVMDFVSNL